MNESDWFFLNNLYIRIELNFYSSVAKIIKAKVASYFKEKIEFDLVYFQEQISSKNSEVKVLNGWQRR